MASELPLELQYKIISYLSQKDSILLLTVCKNWLPHVIRNIYTRVDLYTSKQCERFIECLKENKASVKRNKEKKKEEEPYGYLVKEIILHTSYIFDSTETRELQELTPMVTRFDYANQMSLTDEHLYYFVPLWKHLTALPVYHEDNSEDWIPLLGKQLIYLGCHGNELDYITKSSITTTESNTTTHVPNDQSFLTKTPTFPKLKTLELHLEYTFKPLKLSTIEWIHQICPVLTSLTLILQDIQIIKDIDSIENEIIPYSPLSSLKLDLALLSVDVDCFDYFIHKYPHLNQLEIIDYFSIDIDSDYDSDEEENRNHLFIARQNSKNGLLKWITSNPHLSYLYIDSELENTAVPWDDLKEWVKKYQVSLSSTITTQLDKVSLWKMPFNLHSEKKDHFYSYHLQLP
ncbi:unnamed protein product [Cunninghamella blakesleeana]